MKWAPQTITATAELDVKASRGPATFDIDAVTVRGPAGSSGPSRAVERADRYALVARAQSSGKLRVRTTTAALVGGGIGLAAALGALAFGWLASRRHQAQQ